MAFIYEKPDPKGGTKRWMGRIRIGDDDVAVSLRLKSAGTKRIAQTRVDALQTECQAGAISPKTAEWLGPATTARLERLLAQARTTVTSDAPDGWHAAYLGYIKSCEARDTKTPIAGTARTVERTKKQRMEAIRKMSRWLTENGVPFLKQPYTQTLIDYIEHRKGIGTSPTTLWATEYSYGVLWGDYLARRGLCAKPERDLVREHIPPKTQVVVVLPEPESDAATIRFFRDNRNRTVMREELGGDDGRGHAGVNWRKSRRYMAAWSLALCVRGLGCRPSEATALTWRTVGADLKTVHFISTKTNIAREVPILFEWVRVGMAELRDLHGDDGPVCRSTEGKAWGEDSGPPACWRQILKDHFMPPYHLKKAQKLYIAHTLRLGFPPHVVANWTGHTLTVQEKHYCESKSYLPSRTQDDYGEFGTLSTWGEEVRSHLSAFANLLPGNRR